MKWAFLFGAILMALMAAALWLRSSESSVQVTSPPAVQAVGEVFEPEDPPKFARAYRSALADGWSARIERETDRWGSRAGKFAVAQGPGGEHVYVNGDYESPRGQLPETARAALMAFVAAVDVAEKSVDGMDRFTDKRGDVWVKEPRPNHK